MSDIPAGIFRAYDIRGIAGTQLNTGNIRCIGQAIGAMALDRGRRTLLFGADARLSSPQLAPALQAGILASGCNVIDLGTIPTPLLYFSTSTAAGASTSTAISSDCGVMLTASHNPAEYNGIKIVMENTCLTPEEILEVRARVQALSQSSTVASVQKEGTLQKANITQAYIDYVCNNLHLQRQLRVVVDCGNAVPGLVAPALLRALGCEVIPLFCEPDGHFPNHHPDPTIPENLDALIRQVRADEADLGIALDGDGDRVVLVSNSGVAVDTDRLLMLMVPNILPTSVRKNVVFDVKCSNLLIDVIKQAGGTPIMSRSGHSFMKRKMQETDAAIGAEFSAHVFIRDRWLGHDDGLYVAARFMEILTASEQTLDDMLASLPKAVSTPEFRIPVPEECKFELMEQVARLAGFPGARINRLDGVRADFDQGWGLIRASNTTPALLLRFEADSQAALLGIQRAFRELLERVDSELEIQF